MNKVTSYEKLDQILDTIPKLLLDHAKKSAEKPVNHHKDLVAINIRILVLVY